MIGAFSLDALVNPFSIPEAPSSILQSFSQTGEHSFRTWLHAVSLDLFDQTRQPGRLCGRGLVLRGRWVIDELVRRSHRRLHTQPPVRMLTSAILRHLDVAASGAPSTLSSTSLAHTLSDPERALELFELSSATSGALDWATDGRLLGRVLGQSGPPARVSTARRLLGRAAPGCSISARSGGIIAANSGTPSWVRHCANRRWTSLAGASDPCTRVGPPGLAHTYAKPATSVPPASTGRHAAPDRTRKGCGSSASSPRRSWTR